MKVILRSSDGTERVIEFSTPEAAARYVGRVTSRDFEKKK